MGNVTCSCKVGTPKVRECEWTRTISRLGHFAMNGHSGHVVPQSTLVDLQTSMLNTIGEEGKGSLSNANVTFIRTHSALNAFSVSFVFKGSSSFTIHGSDLLEIHTKISCPLQSIVCL